MKSQAHKPGRRFVELVGLIYACATEPARLPEALRLFNELVGGTTAQLFTRDLASGAILASQVADAAHEPVGRHYVSHWGAFDPRVKWFSSRSSNTVLRCHEQFDEAFVAASSFYQDFMVPHGLRWSLAGQVPGRARHRDGHREHAASGLAPLRALDSERAAPAAAALRAIVGHRRQAGAAVRGGAVGHGDDEVASNAMPPHGQRRAAASRPTTPSAWRWSRFQCGW